MGNTRNDETGNTGIHTFYETITHENEHIVIWKERWGSIGAGSYNQSLDQEKNTQNIGGGTTGDYYPDGWEDLNTSHGFNKVNNDDYHFGDEKILYKGELKSVGYVYEEKRCRQKEKDIADVTKYDNKDWSKDGKQW